MTKKEQDVIRAIEHNFGINKKAVRESLVKAKKTIESALKELRKGRPLITTANVNFAMYDICKAQCLLTGGSVQSKVLGAAEKAAKGATALAVEQTLEKLRPTKGAAKKGAKKPVKAKRPAAKPTRREMTDEEFDNLEAAAWNGELSERR